MLVVTGAELSFFLGTNFSGLNPASSTPVLHIAVVLLCFVFVVW